MTSERKGKGNDPAIARHCAELERCNQRRGRMLSIVDLLDAGTLEEARNQVCGTNGVPAAHFARMDLLLFLRVRGRGWDAHREIATVWETDSDGAQAPLFADGRLDLAASTRVSGEAAARAAERLRTLRAAGARAIGDVRCFVDRRP